MFGIYLKMAFAESGCPVCRIRRKAVERYIFTTLWENVNDITFRQRFLASDGLCPEHAWQLQSTENRLWNDGLKTGILYESLLTAARRRLAREAADLDGQNLPWWHPGRWRNRRNQPAPIAPALCPVCDIASFQDTFYTGELARNMVEPEWRDAYSVSDGLCMFHLRLALDECEPATRAWLLAESENRLKVLHHDLQEYLRKHSWQYRDEPVSEAERASWIRAVAWLREEKKESR